MSKMTSPHQGLHGELAGDSINGNRLLRVHPTDVYDDGDKSKDNEAKSTSMDSDDSKSKHDDSKSKSVEFNSKKGEERGIIIDSLYQEKYQDWFDEGKTPGEVADNLGLDDFGLLKILSSDVSTMAMSVFTMMLATNLAAAVSVAITKKSTGRSKFPLHQIAKQLVYNGQIYI